MDSFSGPASRHPLLRCVTRIGAALDEAEGTSAAGLRTQEKGVALLELTRLIERAQGVKLALMAAGEDVAAESADRDVAAWLAPRVQADHAPTRALLHVAEAIEARWHGVGAALRTGGCSLEQARVIVKALDDQAAADVGAELLGKARPTLSPKPPTSPPRSYAR